MSVVDSCCCRLVCDFTGAISCNGALVFTGNSVVMLFVLLLWVGIPLLLIVKVAVFSVVVVS